jgi:hypothetical protein
MAKNNETYKCPICGNDQYKSKATMASEILMAIGYPKEKSIYGDGSITRNEMAVLYNFVMKHANKEKK